MGWETCAGGLLLLKGDRNGESDGERRRRGEKCNGCDMMKKIIATPTKLCSMNVANIHKHSSKITELKTHLMDKVLQLSLLSPEGDLLLILEAWWSAGWGKQSTNYYT